MRPSTRGRITSWVMQSQRLRVVARGHVPLPRSCQGCLAAAAAAEKLLCLQANTVAAFEDDPVTAQIRKKLRLLHRRVTNLAKKVDSATSEQAKVSPYHPAWLLLLRY